MEGSYISIRGICKNYKNFKALKDIDLDIDKGDFVTILGPSGAGKTTLLKMIAGFEAPSSGEITVDGRDILSMPVNKRNIGMLFQNYALFPHKTIYENVEFPLKIRKIPKEEREEKVHEMLKKVRLTGFEKRYPRQLSGGQQQRVAMARAIVYNPPLLLLDEPMAALDKQLSKQMQIEIRALHDELGLTTISVTHDQEEALTMASKVCVMRDGAIAQISSPEDIYKNPNSEFVASFIGETNIIKTFALKDSDEKGNFTVRLLSNVYSVHMDKAVEKGSETDIAIRPEHFHLLAAGDEIKGLTVQGRVQKIIFIGDIVKVYLKTLDNESFFAKFFADAVNGIHEGDELRFGVFEHDIRAVE